MDLFLSPYTAIMGEADFVEEYEDVEDEEAAAEHGNSGKDTTSEDQEQIEVLKKHNIIYTEIDAMRLSFHPQNFLGSRLKERSPRKMRFVALDVGDNIVQLLHHGASPAYSSPRSEMTYLNQSQICRRADLEFLDHERVVICLTSKSSVARWRRSWGDRILESSRISEKAISRRACPLRGPDCCFKCSPSQTAELSKCFLVL